MIFRTLLPLLRFPAVMSLVIFPLLMASGARAASLAESVVQSSPLGEMSRQYPAMVRQGIREGLLASGHVEPFLADTVAGFASNAFSAPRMTSRLVADLDRNLTPMQLETIHAWYSTALGQRVAMMEVLASRPDNWERLSERGAALADQHGGPDRVDMFLRYDQAMAATATTARIAEAAQRRLLPAYIALMGNRAPDAQTLKRDIEQHRPLVRRQIEAQVFLAFLATYEDFSDADLRRYLDFLESEPGRAFTSVAAGSIEQGVLEPLEAVGSQMARLLGSNR